MVCAGALPWTCKRSALMNMRGLLPFEAWGAGRRLRIRSCLRTEPPLHPTCSQRMGPLLAFARPPRAASAASAKRSCWTGGARRAGRLSGDGEHGTESSSPHAPRAPRALKSGCSEVDEHFMLLALEQARKARDAGEIPVGAVLVSSSGSLVASTHNRVETDRDPTAHAEILALREAARRLGDWRLTGCTLYATLEPCPMCAGALLAARVSSLVYGTRNPLLGADGSWVALLGGRGAADDEKEPAPLASPEARSSLPVVPNGPHPFHPAPTVRRGVLANEAADLLVRFFKRRRSTNTDPNVVKD